MPLIERDRELSLLEDAVAGLEGPQGAVILIDGPAGIGKTRLINAAASLAGNAGVSVLRARGVELERDEAFGIVRQLLEREVVLADPLLRREWTGGAAALSLSIFGSDGVGDRPAVQAERTLGLLHGIYWLVSNMSATRRIVLVVDDAHWADGPSLRALAYLGRRLEGLPVVVMLAARSGFGDPPDDPLAELASDRDVVRLTLGPLSRSGTAQLLEMLIDGDLAPDAVTSCHESSGGNPFLLRELVLALRQDGGEVTEAAVAELAKIGADSLTHAVMLRLGGLGRDAAAVASAVSVLDLDSQLGRVATLAGLDLAAAATAAERLAGAHILADATPLSFAHPLLRAAVYRDLTAVQRTLLHERAARMLRDAGAPAERVVTHLLATEPSQDPRVSELLLVAGRAALSKGAAAIAARYLRRALEEPPHDELLGEVLTHLGIAELQAGDAVAAEPHLRRALAVLTEPEQIVRAALTLAEVLAGTAGPVEAVRVLAEASAGLSGEPALRLDVARSYQSWFESELAAAATAGRRREYARFAGATHGERLALVNAALATAFDPTASAADAVALAHRALGDGALLAEDGDSPEPGSARYVLTMGEELDAAEIEAARGFEYARAHGSVPEFASSCSTLAQACFSRGQLADTVAHGEAIMAAAKDIRRTAVTTRFYVSSPATLIVVPLVEMGELRRARELVADLSTMGDLDTPMLCLIRYGRAVVEMADGAYDAALADFVGYGAVCAQVGYEERLNGWRLGAARAELALGRRHAAVRRAEEALTIARAWGAPGGLGAALRVRALVGGPEQACARLAAAVEVLQASSWRLELAGAMVDYGIALRTTGHRRQAREVLEQGMDLAARCEAQPLTQRARSELLVLGARPRRLMFSGLDSLTASERRVAAMAAEGMTNREIAQALFVTQKTIENHLSNAYRKLDVTSRRELAPRIGQAPTI